VTDIPLATQRELIRRQWARDAAMTRAALRQPPPAGPQAPGEQAGISGAPHDRGEDLLAGQRAQQDPVPETGGRPEPGPRGTPQISARPAGSAQRLSPMASARSWVCCTRTG
jgi:hypothetical protein